MPHTRFRAAAIVAFLAAATGFAFVAIDRGWPCAVWGIESEACGLRQDDSFDATITATHPMQVVVLMAAYVLLAASVVLAAHTSTHGWRRAFGWLSALLPALMLFTNLGSGWLLIPLTVACPLFAALSVWDSARRGWSITYGFGIAATALLIDVFVLAPIIGLGYFSWDSNPWTWLPSALGCLMAALALVRLGAARREPAASGIEEPLTPALP